MPYVLPYDQLLDGVARAGFRCVYPNSGAFEFIDLTRRRVLGYALGDDPTVRPELRQALRAVRPPTPRRLAEVLARQWRTVLPDAPACLAPASHWAHELNHGHADWLSEMLKRLGIDPNPLAGHPSAPAIAFEVDEIDAFTDSVEQLLTNLNGSDFTCLFPGYEALVTLHHHRQLWWRAEASIAGQLEATDPPA